MKKLLITILVLSIVFLSTYACFAQKSVYKVDSSALVVNSSGSAFDLLSGSKSDSVQVSVNVTKYQLDELGVAEKEMSEAFSNWQSKVAKYRRDYKMVTNIDLERVGKVKSMPRGTGDMDLILTIKKDSKLKK